MTSRVAVIGASGYSGAELIALLLEHPGVRIVGLFGSGKGPQPANYGEVFGRFRGRLSLTIEPADPDAILRAKPDVAFLCTPHEASMALAPTLVAHGVRVLDLSAAFRLKDSHAYPTFYAFEHTQPALLREAVYGMPELQQGGASTRELLRRARLVAVPGCYPTSIILPLEPLARAGALAKDSRGAHELVIVDSTSGVSGAGRKSEQKFLFCEVSQQAYGVFSHRHQPEIDAYAGVQTLFTPHLGPYERGILSTIHATLAPGWDEAKVRGSLQAAYGSEACVRLCAPGVWPSVQDVRGTNFCDIALACKEIGGRTRIIIASAVDNLIKGAAGQALQCMNIMLGARETEALLPAPHAGGSQ